MKNLKKLLFAAGLVAVAIVSVPPKAEAAGPWCNICLQTADCFACCRCGGTSVSQCILFCE